MHAYKLLRGGHDSVRMATQQLVGLGQLQAVCANPRMPVLLGCDLKGRASVGMCVVVVEQIILGSARIAEFPSATSSTCELSSVAEQCCGQEAMAHLLLEQPCFQSALAWSCSCLVGLSKLPKRVVVGPGCPHFVTTTRFVLVGEGLHDLRTKIQTVQESRPLVQEVCPRSSCGGVVLLTVGCNIACIGLLSCCCHVAA